MIENQYLDEFVRTCGPEALTRRRWDWVPEVHDSMRMFQARTGHVFRFAFAVPNDEAITTCVKYSPIIEVGAGAGYWAHLIRRAGGDIIATDLEPSKPWGSLVREVGERLTMWVDVQKSDAAEAAAAYTDRTLMLCWPPMDDMAERALAAYRGRHVIYIGESEGGCTGNEEFHTALNNEWKEVAEVRIPQWWGINDVMVVYERKQERRIRLGDD